MGEKKEKSIYGDTRTNNVRGTVGLGLIDNTHEKQKPIILL
jgi:hypothetical protein